MNIEIRHLRAFQMVADELNFRKAAERLRVAQPALTRTIKDLEQMMEVQLFERSTRTVTITNAGKIFRRAVEDLLPSLANAVVLARQAEKGVAGELRIGYNDFAMYGLLPVIVRRFRAAYPQVSIWLGQFPSPEMVKQVAQGRLDAAFHLGPTANTEVGSNLIRSEHLVAVVPDTHRLAERGAIPLSELALEDFVMGRHDTWGAFHQLVLSYCRDNGFEMNIIQESLNSDGIINLVAAGLGVTLYVDSDWLYTTRGVAVVRLDQPGPRIETLVSWRKKSLPQQRTLQNFLEVAEEVLASEG